MSEAQQRGRKTLLLIAATFLVPIALAAYMYFSGSAWRPALTTQHGELIMPPRSLPDIEMPTPTGPGQLYGTWNLMVLSDDQCAADCVQALENIRQIRLSLGPKMPRVQTVLIPARHDSLTDDVAVQHPALIVIAPDAAQEIRDIVGSFTNGQIFIVDPLGNLMMQYKPGTEMGDIREDLGHLLKLSGIG